MLADSCGTCMKTPSPLKFEVSALVAKIERVDNEMGDIENDFFADGGICCPSCGVPGYSEMSLKQERRVKRLKQLRDKLARDA